MSEIWPNEGLDYLLNIFPRAAAVVPSTLWVGLFTSQTATTVPAATAVLSTQTGVTEAAFSGYARRPISSGLWGAVGDKTVWSQSGRGTAASEISFNPAEAADATPVNEAFIATAVTGGVALYYANFDDTTAETITLGKIIKVTPTLALLA